METVSVFGLMWGFYLFAAHSSNEMGGTGLLRGSWSYTCERSAHFRAGYLRTALGSLFVLCLISVLILSVSDLSLLFFAPKTVGGARFLPKDLPPSPSFTGSKFSPHCCFGLPVHSPPTPSSSPWISTCLLESPPKLCSLAP